MKKFLLIAFCAISFAVVGCDCGGDLSGTPITPAVKSDGGSKPCQMQWFSPDMDRDGFGDERVKVKDCVAPQDDNFLWVPNSGDCDDLNEYVNPGMGESCNNIDDDCDRAVDNGWITVTVYRDADSDSFGSPEDALTVSDCQGQGPTIPTGYVLNGGDCDDENPAIYPDLCYPDSDNDGHGDDQAEGVLRCECHDNESDVNDDCDDTQSNVYEGAEEICDGVDNDCDTKVDEGLVFIMYLDYDRDSFGDPIQMVMVCTPRAGYVLNNEDCDDQNGSIYPGAPEVVADGLDQNCDRKDLCFVDADNDGFGSNQTVVDTDTNCMNSSALTANNNLDCDDQDADAHLQDVDGDGNTTCDLLPDCDDNDSHANSLDKDNDGFISCAYGVPGERVDCDDTDDSVYPGAPEIRGDGIDQNCDGVDLIDSEVDDDGDCFCESETRCVLSRNPDCTQLGYGDCHDGRDDIYPRWGVTEGELGLCELENHIDHDCDGRLNDGCPVYDDDGDCYCDLPIDSRYECTGSNNLSCSGDFQPVLLGDCDDSAVSAHPGGTEIPYDGIDQDCNGADLTDEFIDDDGDCFCESLVECISSVNPDCGPGELLIGDCNDDPFTNGASFHPQMSEVVADGIDQNCNGVDRCYQDLDGDGVGTLVEVNDNDLNCTNLSLDYTSDRHDDCNDQVAGINPLDLDDDGSSTCDAKPDCDDADSGLNWNDVDGDGYFTCTVFGQEHLMDCDDRKDHVHPGAPERCDYLDNDCDTQVDEDFVVGLYLDSDNDDFGRMAVLPDMSLPLCPHDPAPVGYVRDHTDCNDLNPDVNPEAVELLADSFDQNCDGVEECYGDLDGDGVGSDTSPGVLDNNLNCADNSMPRTSDRADDCDDLHADLNPLDVDGDGSDLCNQPVDCDDADYGLNWEDADNDGYATCGVNPDCNDYRSDVHPFAAELCDTVDNNCNGILNEGCNDHDDDGDGFSELQGDCDDTLATVYPGAAEVMNDGIDQDCSGADYVSAEFDFDGDCFCASSVRCFHSANAACLPSSLAPGDCDDGRDDINPGEVDLVADGEDTDCNGVEACYQDLDHDSYGSSTVVDDTDMNCDNSSAATASRSGDCNDFREDINPGATEVCNGVDDNCASGIDENGVCDTDAGLSGVDAGPKPDTAGQDVVLAPDAGFSDVGGSDTANAPDAGTPDATEADSALPEAGFADTGPCADDETLSLWYEDADEDGYGNPASALWSCTEPDGYLVDNTDCDDSRRYRHPGAAEACEPNLDLDCDGVLSQNDEDSACGGFLSYQCQGGGQMNVALNANFIPMSSLFDITTDNPLLGDGNMVEVSSSVGTCSEVTATCGADKFKGNGAPQTLIFQVPAWFIVRLKTDRMINPRTDGGVLFPEVGLTTMADLLLTDLNPSDGLACRLDYGIEMNALRLECSGTCP